jgi:hypothetical protein
MAVMAVIESAEAGKTKPPEKAYFPGAFETYTARDLNPQPSD